MKHFPPKSGVHSASGLVVCGLFAIIFIAFFRRYSEFGFYADEHACLGGGVIDRDWRAELDNCIFCLTRWPQGRPLAWAINLSLLPSLIFHLAGLSGLYITAFAIVACNTTLLYRLVSQYHSPLAAFSTAGFYALAPADTVQISLGFTYHFEIGILFGILSAQAAIRGQRIRYAVFLCIGLLMVEPVAMFALLVPLFFNFRRSRPWLWGALLHVSVWLGVVLAVLLARRLIGDPWGGERVSEIAANPVTIFQRGFTSAFVGLRTHFDLVFERLIQPFKEADDKVWYVMLGAAAIASLTAWTTRSYLLRSQSSILPLNGDAEATERLWWPEVRLLLAGCATMLAVYFCYFRSPWYPANWRTGFMSGVHLIAALGSCLVFSALVSLLMKVLPLRFRAAAVLLPIATFTCLAGFGELVQRDYANSWKFQRKFWQAYVRLCPDATDGTFVLVLDRNFPQLRYTDLYSWGYEFLPAALFYYQNLPLNKPISPNASAAISPVGTLLVGQPPAIGASPVTLLTRPPSVILTAPELVTAIKSEGQKYTWKPTYYFMLPKTSAQQPEAGNIIVLTYDAQGNWHRIEGEIAVDGGILPLRPAGGDDLLRRVHKRPLAAVYGL